MPERDPDFSERQEALRTRGVSPKLLAGPTRRSGHPQGRAERGPVEGGAEQSEGAVGPVLGVQLPGVRRDRRQAANYARRYARTAGREQGGEEVNNQRVATGKKHVRVRPLTPTPLAKGRGEPDSRSPWGEGGRRPGEGGGRVH